MHTTLEKNDLAQSFLLKIGDQRGDVNLANKDKMERKNDMGIERDLRRRGLHMKNN